MMCDRRYCGCALRGANLTRIGAIVFVAVMLAGATAIQDLLDGILIALSVFTAGILAIFATQVRRARKRTVRLAPAAAAAAPRPAPAAPAHPAPAAAAATPRPALAIPAHPAPAAAAAAPRPALAIPAQARRVIDGSREGHLDGERPGQVVLGSIHAQL
jgi:hypothetical protein